jgi:hypothetical protein
MRLQITSRKFLKELQRRRSGFGSKRLAARLRVPEGLENRWWYFQEFGTATHNPDSPNSSGYNIYPVTRGALAWTAPDGTRISLPYVGFPYSRPHPGVPAQRFIAEIEPTINATVGSMVGKTLLSSKFDFEALHQALLSEIMPEVKKQVVDSMATKLTGTREDGKLLGRAAADVFNEITTIEEV